jgi:hypothetical protein
LPTGIAVSQRRRVSRCGVATSRLRMA